MWWSRKPKGPPARDHHWAAPAGPMGTGLAARKSSAWRTWKPWERVWGHVMDASVEEVLMAALHVSTLHCLWIKYLAPSWVLLIELVVLAWVLSSRRHMHTPANARQSAQDMGFVIGCIGVPTLMLALRCAGKDVDLSAVVEVQLYGCYWAWHLQDLDDKDSKHARSRSCLRAIIYPVLRAAAMLIHRQYDKHAWPLRSRGDVFTVLRLATGATWAYLASDWLLNHLPGTFTVGEALILGQGMYFVVRNAHLTAVCTGDTPLMSVLGLSQLAATKHCGISGAYDQSLFAAGGVLFWSGMVSAALPPFVNQYFKSPQLFTLTFPLLFTAWGLYNLVGETRWFWCSFLPGSNHPSFSSGNLQRQADSEPLSLESYSEALTAVSEVARARSCIAIARVFMCGSSAAQMSLRKGASAAVTEAKQLLLNCGSTLTENVMWEALADCKGQGSSCSLPTRPHSIYSARLGVLTYWGVMAVVCIAAHVWLSAGQAAGTGAGSNSSSSSSSWRSAIPLTVLRKGYHLMALLLIVPALITDPELLVVSLAFVFAALSFLETVRQAVLPWPGYVRNVTGSIPCFRHLANAGPAFVHHLALVVGWAGPIWLGCSLAWNTLPKAPLNVITLWHDAGQHSQLKVLQAAMKLVGIGLPLQLATRDIAVRWLLVSSAGLVSIGVGSTAAAVANWLWGRRRVLLGSADSSYTYEGMVAAVVCMLLATAGLTSVCFVHGNLPMFTALCIARHLGAVAVLEASSQQMHALVLPLYLCTAMLLEVAMWPHTLAGYT